VNRRLSRALLSKLIVTTALVGALSCTAEKRHRTLTFFFDGVPPLGEPEGEKPGPQTPAAPTAAPKTAAFTGSEHEPARNEKGCGNCHNREASFALLKPRDQICLTCHADKTRQFPYMHGPAAVGGCAECHDPHRSPLPHLLRMSPEKLCFQCHDRTPPGAKPPRCARPSDDARCTDCHNPHGGQERYFLVGRSGEVQGGGKTAAPDVAPEAR
jgi:predicted CXXCH cytochrome family protein